MKKLLSILGTIGLSTTSLISCEKPNNNENGEGNKPEPNKPQEPPNGSHWKLINKNTVISEIDNKYYLVIWEYNWTLSLKLNKDVSDLAWLNMIINVGNPVYCWNGTNKPKTPEIDKNTGKITDWKEQKD